MKVVAQNRRARYDYEIIDTVEAGIMLTGQEAKSCRQGNANLAGAYVSFASGKAVLKNASIAPYAYAGPLPEYDLHRDRPLLLKKAEAAKLDSLLAEKGVSLVPLEIKAGKYIKVLLGLGRGRKRLDKRENIKKRDIDRQLRRGEDA